MPRRRQSETELTLQGIGVSPGVVTGKVFLLTSSALRVPRRPVKVHQLDHELSRFEDAITETRRQIKQIQKDMEQHTGPEDASILDAHLLVLDDRSFVEQVMRELREKKLNVEAIVADVSEKYASMLDSVSDEYLRERVADVKDVSRRILRNLQGDHESRLDRLPKGAIIVTRDLAPSETASLRKELAGGFAIDMGSPTCHTAVLARALEIPGIVGLRDVTRQVQDGDDVLMDGNRGVLVIRPGASTLRKYGKVAELRRNIERELKGLRAQPAETKDGRRITLAANIETPDELDAVLQYGAEGVGLFRSEYLYLSREDTISELDEAAAYQRVAEGLAPHSVIIRTLDIGGDKFRVESHMPLESNPFLGCRSIRLSLMHPEDFKRQLRAILRASVTKNIKIMYPMISSAAEVIRANELLAEAKRELDAAKVPYDPGIKVGVMIEIPAAALMADVLARHVSFFSIGTNDLIQYTLAVDRVNERVAYLYEPTHPAVLNLIRTTVEAAQRNRIWVGLCGEMGADPLLAPLLIGLGVDELSVAPSAVPPVKDAIRSVTFQQARQLADESLRCETAVEVLELCRKLTREAAPELLELM